MLQLAFIAVIVAVLALTVVLIAGNACGHALVWAGGPPQVRNKLRLHHLPQGFCARARARVSTPAPPTRSASATFDELAGIL